MIALYVVSGVSAALVGLIMAWQLGAGSPAAAVGLEVTVVSAVLLGGGRLAGGPGSVAGTLLALLVISIVGNGLALANVNPYVGPVLSAALLILALVIDRPHRRSGTRPAGPRPDRQRVGPSQLDRSIQRNPCPEAVGQRSGPNRGRPDHRQPWRAPSGSRCRTYS